MTERLSLYREVTCRIIAELEEGRFPWVQPWDAARCPCTMPRNAVSGRQYSGVNVLILWAAGVGGGFGSQRWLTYKQATAAGGNVRRGEKGTVVCYADRFTPKDEAAKAQGEDREARTIAFLKRFTLFNLDQCEGLPEGPVQAPVPVDPVLAIAEADRVIAASGADVRIGGSEAFYAPGPDFVQVPPQNGRDVSPPGPSISGLRLAARGGAKDHVRSRDLHGPQAVQEPLTSSALNPTIARKRPR